MPRTPHSIEVSADWINRQADWNERKGFVVTAKAKREKADHLMMQAYYLRKYGTVNPWA